MPESIDTSLVRIHTKAGSVVGAGFLVGPRHFLTCAHVIAQALDIAAATLDPPTAPVSLDFPQIAPHTLLTAKVVFWDPLQEDGRGDIAGLELLDEPPIGAAAAHVAPADQVWDHPFRALGFPKGYDNGVWATGRLLGRQGTNWIQIEDIEVPGFAVIAGFSGAPVWDTQSQGIVGMIVAASQEASAKTAFVIPSDVLTAAWPQLASLMRPPVPRNPYKGLHAFTEHDAGDFFGREALIDELATAVEAALTREYKEGQRTRLLTVVLGPSGSGKSSVVMAGLLPYLRNVGVFNSKEWVYLDPIFPGAHPLEALAVSLVKQLPARSPVSIHDDLASASARSLHLLVCQLTSSPQQKIVLPMDQFEEVFTLTTDEAERRHFFELLVAAVTEPRGPLFVILTLRADFYDRPMQYPELYRLIDAHHVSVLPLERDELRKVIEQPANLQDVQLTFAQGLVDELLLDMQGQSGALPLLEFTLDQLFQRRNGHQLTLQAYHEMGGVKGALSQHAEETYQALPSDVYRQSARDIFLRLIEPGTSEQDTTRRRADRSEFERADPIQAQQMRETLEAFINARLLTTNQVGGQTTVEVSHEALIREWKRLAEWLREARKDILFQQSLSDDVAEWEQRKRPGDRLYRGAQLKEAQVWATRNWPSERELTFLRASATRRIQSLVSLVTVVLVLLTLSGITGWFVLKRPPDPTVVTKLQDNVDGSLRYCINNAPSGSTITFAQGLRGIIQLTGDLTIAGVKTLTLVGPDASQLAISGGNADALIKVAKDTTLNISGLSFKNTNSKALLVAFLVNSGTLTVTKSIISDNTASSSGSNNYGGGIANSGTLTLKDSTISNNTSSGNPGTGGGIENSGKLTVINSIISNNKASSSGGYGEGGGIVNSGTLTVTKSIISDNTASSSGSNSFGGGIANSGTLTVKDSTISNNTSSGKQGIGGGIENEGKLTVINSTFSNNTASSSGGYSFGGGIANLGTMAVTNSTFSGNMTEFGGGISNEGAMIVTNSTFSNNTASGGNGGGVSFIVVNKDSFAIIRFCTLYGNSSRAGGGIWVDPTGSGAMTISGNIVAANSARDGPDIFGALTSDGYDLLTNVAGAKGLNTSTDRQVVLADLKVDSSLSNNGGPTQTLALLQGSQAIDVVPLQACSISVTDASGQNVTITTDQRGHSRPDGSENACDVGTYESSY